MPNPTLILQNPADSQNQLTAAINHRGHIQISVSDELAMDSYNQTFECTLTLTNAQSYALRDWLTHALEQ